MLKKIDHIGIAVHDIDKVLDLFSGMMGMNVVSAEIQKDHGIKVVRLELGGSQIELYQPLSGDSVTARFLKRQGEGIHHICFSVEDIENTVEELTSKGLRLYKPKSKERSDEKVVFLDPYTTHRILIELTDEKEESS